MTHYLKSWTNQLATIGNKPADSERQKLHNRFLVYMALLMNSGAILWGSICIYNNHLLPVIIPSGFILLTVTNLWYFSVSKRFRVVRFFQILLNLLTPFFFQWSMGGFMASGAVMFWAMTAMLGSLTFQHLRLTLRWFLAYVFLTILSSVMDAQVSKYAPPISSATMTMFFVINVLGVSVVIFGLLHYLIRSRELAHAELEFKNQALIASQTQLIQAAKMASVGLLTAGIAHEMNNPIGAINSATDLSRRCISKIKAIFETGSSFVEEEKSRKLQHLLGALQSSHEVTEEACERMIRIVNSLKNFARLDRAAFQKVDLHEGLESTLTLIEHDFKKRITVVKEYGEIPAVFCLPGELNQVFMNLLTNAVRAIKGKGTITIRTLLKNGNIHVQIADTGVGISEEQMEQLFDPNFTLKGSRVKARLGLFTSYRILQKHRGEIKVESEVNKGSTFTIILPTDLKKPVELPEISILAA